MQIIPDGDNDHEDPPGGGPAAMVRIVIADDHVLVLDMLRTLLGGEFDIVGAASSGDEVLRLARAAAPDLILLDVGMPGLDGLDTARMLRANGVTARLAYLTMENDPKIAARAFALGASAYIAKTHSSGELLQALRIVMAGGRYLAPMICGGDVDELLARYSRDPVARLSSREVEVLKLLVAGMSMKAAARQLGIVPRTVAFHKYRAMQTLGLRDNVALMEFAVRHGMVGRRPGDGGAG
jgi:DNA-binding NarL/FixJ family response regulator